MTGMRSTETTGPSLTRDWLSAARYDPDRRRTLLILAAAALAAGLAFNWNWLVAAGVAPILIGVLPCLAMCALGLCIKKAGGKSCATATNNQEPGDLAADPAPVHQAASREASSGHSTNRITLGNAGAPLTSAERQPPRKGN